jgi:hypothetical protein
MATQADIRRIALALPETEEAENKFAFSVRNKDKLKGFVWVWMERIDPKKPRVANPTVVAIRVPTLGQRDAMISAEPRKFFTEPHYAGFPAVLARIAELTVADLRELIPTAWRTQAPRALTGDASTKTAKKKTTARKKR